MIAQLTGTVVAAGATWVVVDLNGFGVRALCTPATASAVRWWVGLKDYILLQLTGELVTEVSHASGTGLLDVHTRDWNELMTVALYRRFLADPGYFGLQ